MFKKCSNAVLTMDTLCGNCGQPYGSHYAHGACPEENGKMTTLYDLPKRDMTPRMKTWWECYVEGTGGGFHHRHTTLQSAKTEAERLARRERKTVYLFECIGICKVAGVEWETPTLW